MKLNWPLMSNNITREDLDVVIRFLDKESQGPLHSIRGPIGTYRLLSHYIPDLIYIKPLERFLFKQCNDKTISTLHLSSSCKYPYLFDFPNQTELNLMMHAISTQTKDVRKSLDNSQKPHYSRQDPYPKDNLLNFELFPLGQIVLENDTLLVYREKFTDNKDNRIYYEIKVIEK